MMVFTLLPIMDHWWPNINTKRMIYKRNESTSKKSTKYTEVKGVNKVISLTPLNNVNGGR